VKKAQKRFQHKTQYGQEGGEGRNRTQIKESIRDSRWSFCPFCAENEKLQMRAGSKTSSVTHEIQGNKRGQRVKQTRQKKEKHRLTLCSVTKLGREKRKLGEEVSFSAAHCARAAQSSANIDNKHRLSK
jgi:hypothetical protein